MKKRFLMPLILLAAVVLAAAAFFFWMSDTASAQPEALAALVSDDFVTVTPGNWWTFESREGRSSTGFLFYPGGKVDPRAYAPLLKKIASQGFFVVLVPMPLNLAVFAPEKATEIMAAYPQIENWAIGGHSLGGAMAASFAATHPEGIRGLVLMAAYPPRDLTLSESGVRVISIYGEKDGLATPTKIKESRPQLPRDTAWVEIKGGNHGQFGYYGYQAGDNLAEISREVQQNTILASVTVFLRSLSN